MKTLFLIRHAKSSWDDTALPDKDRPLGDRGRRDAPKMGKRLAKRDVKPDLILSSPARRALTTAEIVAKKLDYKLKDIVVDDRLQRLEFVRQLVLAGAPISYLMNPQAPEAKFHFSDVQAAARESGQQITVLNASSEPDIDNAFTVLADRRGALIVSTDPFFVSRFHQIVTLAANHKIPTIYDRREFVVAGGLISYGTDLRDVYRQIGVYAGRIIAGAKPSGLPVIQPTKFELVINLQTAKMLGISVPPNLLALADEVIE